MISSTKLKIIFLDFDGVLDTAFYDSYLEQHNMPSCDESGRPVFDPVCIGYLKQIVETTNAQIVVSSDWKYYDSLEDLLKDVEKITGSKNLKTLDSCRRALESYSTKHNDLCYALEEFQVGGD